VDEFTNVRRVLVYPREFIQGKLIDWLGSAFRDDRGCETCAEAVKLAGFVDLIPNCDDEAQDKQ
jgi:hypothetical protein